MSTGRIVVMGVAGSGKTTVGTTLAGALGLDFLDGDQLHPPTNIAKMAAGHPLDDDDRRPWLAAVGRALADASGIVIACSALKRRHRDGLRGAPGVRFVFLDLDPSTARDRAAHRSEHFMGPSMIDSQFDALERPDPVDEPDVVPVDATAPVADVVRAAIRGLSTP